ncbi:MAG: hypothetical protein R3B96_23485 [Pirellulaceae bacterium]
MIRTLNLDRSTCCSSAQQEQTTFLRGMTTYAAPRCFISPCPFPSIPAVLMVLTLTAALPESVGASTLVGGEPVVEAPNPAGCWQGEWKSCSSGHHSARERRSFPVVTVDAEPSFAVDSSRSSRFRYSVTLHTVSVDGDTVHLAGSQNLEPTLWHVPLHGRGHRMPFRARYSSCKDRGQFVMCR